MKKLLISVILIMGSLFPLLSQKELNVVTKIEKVTIYLNNAQVERSATVNLPSGNSEIIISGLSQYLDPNSIRLAGKGNFVIMSHQAQLKYPEPPEVKQNHIPDHILKRISVLTDSLDLISYEIQENKFRSEVFQNEKNYLQNSKVISGADTLTSLREGLIFFRAKMIEINSELLKISKRERVLLKIKADLDTRLSELRNYSHEFVPITKPSLPETVVRLSVISDKAVPNATIELIYNTSGVSWEPLYELKIDDITKPVQLILKANVTQQTGENWEKSKFVFSTGKPTIFKTLPILTPWYLTYFMPQTVHTGNFTETVSTRKTQATSAAGIATSADVAFEAKPAFEQNIMTQNILFAEYEVGLPYTIISDGKLTTIPLMSANLEANYHFIAIPKKDKDAFMTANLRGWEKLSLIQGHTNIIYQNSVISRTFIDPSVAVDSLLVSLGVDKRLTVERKKVSDKSKDRIVGNIRERTVHMEITLKNQHQTEINVIVKDQIPITSVQDIKILIEEYKDAKYDENSGELEWNLTMKPNEVKKLSFRYTVKYDKTKNLLAE